METLKSPFLETDEETFDVMCNLDYKGAFFCMQRAAKIMIETKIQGNIIVISSNSAKAHFADVSVYGSIKAALTKLAEQKCRDYDFIILDPPAFTKSRQTVHSAARG